MLILNDCLYIDENSFSESIIKQMNKINIFSMNVVFVVFLCVKGIPLSLIDVRFIVDSCKNLQPMEMSHSTNERDNECSLLASECDVSLLIYRRVFKRCCKLLCNSIIKLFYVY